MQFLIQKNKRGRISYEKNKEIKKANEKYEYLTVEAAERRIAYLIDKTKKDYNTQIFCARNEGYQMGIEKR